MDLEFHQLDLRHADLRIRDEDRRRRLLASLAELGQQAAVVVIAEGDRYVLIDGYQRVELLQRLGRDTVAATVWALPEAEALVARHQLATTTATALEQGWLLSRLQGQGLAQVELARRLCRSKSWVSRRLALVAVLPEEVQAQVRVGTVPPQAAMKSLVPLARANRAQCAALATALGRTRVSVREVAALYQAWRRATGAGRARVVAEPQLYLKVVRAEAAAVASARTGLVRALRQLARSARAAEDAAQAGDVGSTRPTWEPAWNDVQRALGGLQGALATERTDAGPEHANEHPEAP
jgi:ParB-like chromosome segregation protein Spo0J